MKGIELKLIMKINFLIIDTIWYGWCCVSGRVTFLLFDKSWNSIQVPECGVFQSTESTFLSPRVPAVSPFVRRSLSVRRRGRNCQPAPPHAKFPHCHIPARNAGIHYSSPGLYVAGYSRFWTYTSSDGIPKESLKNLFRSWQC